MINVAGQIGRVLVEFLEVAVTSVVFLKGIYPQGLFFLSSPTCL